MSAEERVDRMNRLALVLLSSSALTGLACTALGAWLWTLEWAVAAGVGGIAVTWGFLGSLSWISVVGAAQVERAAANAALNRRIRAGTAETERGTMSLVPVEEGGDLSLVTDAHAPLKHRA